MDFGIRGKTALVCAASKGMGRGCAMALAQEGVNLVILARGAEALHAAAEDIRSRTGVKVTAITCDITTPEGRDLALRTCPERGTQAIVSQSHGQCRPYPLSVHS